MTAARTVRATMGMKERPIATTTVAFEAPSAVKARQCQDQQRQRQHGLDDAAQDVVDRTGEKSHHEAERRTEPDPE